LRIRCALGCGSPVRHWTLSAAKGQMRTMVNNQSLRLQLTGQELSE
jgi:hypothetical protein